MKFMLLFSFLTLTQILFAQKNSKENYLLIRIGADYDFANKRNTFFILAETGCDDAKNIYSLRNYVFKKNAVNADGTFYYDKKDTTTNL